MMAERATPEALRRAADLIVEGIATRGTRGAYIFMEAGSILPDGLLEPIAMLADPLKWHRDIGAMTWLAQAARLRLLVEAWYAERRAEGFSTEDRDGELLRTINDWFVGTMADG